MEETSRMPLLKWCLFLFLGTIVMLLFYGLFQAPLYEPIPLWVQLLFLPIFSFAIIGLYLYFERLYARCNPQTVGKVLSKRNLLSLTAKGFFVGACYFVVLVAVMMLLDVYGIKSCQFEGPQLLLWFVAFFLVAVGEECVFRGIVFRLIDDRWGFWVAIIVSSFLFGILHWANDNGTLWSGIAISLEAGFLLGVAYKYAGSLWLPIGIHWAWNFTQGSIFGFAVSGDNAIGTPLIQPQLSGPEILTGGVFGAEASVIAVVLGVLVSGWFLYRFKCRKCCNSDKIST